MKKFVVISHVSEPKADKNGNTYKTVEFSTPGFENIVDDSSGEIIQVLVEPRKTSINLYEKSYLNGSMQFGYSANVGSKILGDIVTKNVATYKIPYTNKDNQQLEREVSTYTTVVLGDCASADWDSKMVSAFRNKGHELAKPAISNFSVAKEKEESTVQIFQ